MKESSGDVAIPVGVMPETGYAVLHTTDRDGQGRWLQFSNPSELITATETDQVLPLLQRVTEAQEAGYFTAGFLSYEASPAFDPTMASHESSDFPLACFGIYPSREVIENPSASSATPTPSMPSWRSTVTQDDYRSHVQQIRKEIQAGNTYQTNYSLRYRAILDASPYDYFLSLIAQHSAPYAAYFQLPDHAILSLSPELFFTLHGDQIQCRPMKGTAPRGTTPEEDTALKRKLRESDKECAENLMIVDMVRNDLGRIAEPGSIQVDNLFQIETYESVLQMTSRVTATVQSNLKDVFGALFPSASITGAPKISTMSLIRHHEPEPRGIYTGTIGYAGPDGASFNVAIRTAAVDLRTGSIEYGVGSGIVWDSDADSEYRECQTKSGILRQPGFSLLETLLWEPDSGCFLLDRHLDRLCRSAAHFLFCCDESVVRDSLNEFLNTLSPEPHRIRLTVDRSGCVAVEASLLTRQADRSFTVALASDPVDSNNPWLYHKTTHRDVYTQQLRLHPDCDDVLLQNERGELTESCIANLVLHLDGQLVTPPVSSGLLAGCFRQHLLEEGSLTERRLFPEDLVRSEEVFLINSVRRWIPIAGIRQ